MIGRDLSVKSVLGKMMKRSIKRIMQKEGGERNLILRRSMKSPYGMT